MDKKEYFLRSINASACTSREWILRCFSIVIDGGKDDAYSLEHREDGVYVNIPDESNNLTWVKLNDCEPYQVPFVYHESMGNLKVGDLRNVDRDIKDTSWGVVLLNAVVLIEACGDKIPFMEGPFTPGDIEKIFVERMADNPKEGEERDPDKLYVDEWLAVGKAVGFMDGFEIFIPSITEKALQAYPDLDKDKKELFDKYTEEELRDPIVQTKIQSELVSKQKEFMKGDPSEGFLFKGKTLNMAIKRMFLIHGPEAGFDFGKEATLVPGTLDEGIDPKYFVEMVNSLRAGSYFRGAMTAIAGADVDLMARIYQNSLVQDDFCGTGDVFTDVVVNERYMGRYMMVGGKRVHLTKENYDTYKGTRQDFYDPCYCKADENDICSICIGSNQAAYKTSIGSSVAEKQSVLMYVMMDAAHAKELKVVSLKEDWLT